MSDCKHFGMCGGCAYRHIPYEKQLENKENEVKELIGEYIDENVNGYITFKAFNSNNGYCYFDNITIRHVDNQIEGTFDEYPLGTFDGTASDQYKTIIYCGFGGFKRGNGCPCEGNRFPVFKGFFYLNLCKHAV